MNERQPKNSGKSTNEIRALDRSTLKWVLTINLGQCVAGVMVGFWAESTALIAAALDNLADASVYGVSLYAIGRAARIKVLAARLSGWLLVGLALGVLLEAVRRFFGGEAPIGGAMMAMAAVNAGLNLVCLRLLSRHRGNDVNFKASSIFTSNDSIANVGIVVSGALVMWLDSNAPDLLLGVVVAGVAAYGGKEILEEAAKTAAYSKTS
ncbi:cation transporter [Paracandidimonas lactea]|uniref:cation transporter n=1 Tax=Paracandidimonas lactea TaxID=2895524 RepID=UPI00210358FB|nr:cation transporter [Paracandidimonas lactea]